MIDTIDQKEKIFNRWIDTIGGQHDQEYLSIASIVSIGIDPLPIVPIYGYIKHVRLVPPT